jgi:acyl-CoA reductase-like NAD-dependent aldehyde dehydrogenase
MRASDRRIRGSGAVSTPDDMRAAIAAAHDAQPAWSANLPIARGEILRRWARQCGSSVRRVTRVSPALEFGMVGVNTASVTGPPIPFGGWKRSGLGREGSRHGILEFMERSTPVLAA